MKVALIQNRIQRGGRMHVMLAQIKVLNDLGITPVVLTLKSYITIEDIKSAYGYDLKFNIKIISKEIRIPFEWHIIYFNLVCRKYLSNYDLVINHNNTSVFLSNYKKLISYHYFPRKFRVQSPLQDIHFPEGGPKNFFDIRGDLFRLASILYRSDKKLLKDEKIITISNFSKNAIVESTSINAEDIDIIYPPVSIMPLEKHSKVNNQVISLGRFSSDKRQLEQIDIASKLPEFNFIIAGFMNDKKYFEACQQKIENGRMDNVTLLPNGDKEVILTELQRSAYFLHSLQNEPFGITAVQGITQGCIPLVHNSGGQTEVVPNAALRYDNVDDAIEKLKLLANRSKEEKLDIVNELYENIKQFSFDNFNSKFEKAIRSTLNL